METSIKLYTLNYYEVRTYLLALAFVACNMVLPQVFHLIPQGGFIFAPLSLVILAGSYKFGWKTGLLAAVLSPFVNHLVFGMPALDVLSVMTSKLMILAIIAGLTAQYFNKITIPLLVGVVLVSELIGGLVELALTGNIAFTIADFTIGWPGLLLQVFGTYIIIKYFK